jgi:hypothetical protein
VIDALGRLLDSDGFALALLALLALEAIALTVLHRRTGRAPRPALVLPFLGAGGGFALALLLHRRAAPGPAATLGFAAAMLLALAFHVGHLAALATLDRRTHGRSR